MTTQMKIVGSNVPVGETEIAEIKSQLQLLSSKTKTLRVEQLVDLSDFLITRRLQKSLVLNSSRDFEGIVPSFLISQCFGCQAILRKRFFLSS
jgi:hypothetical protein